ncbi:MAG: hypothetical protein AMJ73_09425, partial [candidate division Zixibacteria bacterium SM1_73]
KLDPHLASYDKMKKKVSLYDQLKIKAEHKKITSNQVKDLENSYDVDQKRIASLEKELVNKKQIESSLSQLKEKLTSSEKKLEQARTVYMKLEASLKSAKDEKARLQSQMANIEELGPFWKKGIS